MKLYNDLPLSYWVKELDSAIFCHKWGSVTDCVRAISFLIDCPDLYSTYLGVDFGSDAYVELVRHALYAGRRALEG